MLTPLAARMAKNRVLGRLAVRASGIAGNLALGLGYKTWEMGSALNSAAAQTGLESYTHLLNSYSSALNAHIPGKLVPEPAGYLTRGWVLANHKLVSLHAAFISSVLSTPDNVVGKEMIGFIFASQETVISTAMMYLAWHSGIAIHEMGHYLTAAKLTALNKSSQDAAGAMRGKKGFGGWLSRVGWYAKMFVQIPWGKFEGVKNEGGNYAPDAGYNLAVAASGPRWSGILAAITLPIATLGIGLGLAFGSETAIYIGRFFLAPGAVGLLDRFLADRGKLRDFREREAEAAQKALRASRAMDAVGELSEQLVAVRDKLVNTRMLTITLADGTKVSAPWQWRNCAMGGRHTEKEFPESNISMQEGMFIPLSAKTYEQAQDMTLSLQTRLKEIIESAEGGRVMGVGLEGGIAPYLEKEKADKVPEQRMWRLMKQAILDCGFNPGVDVVIALDPAASELEVAYRKENEQPDSVGMYLFWRDKSRVVMSRDEVLELYRQAIERDGVPIVSIEDGFGERDHQGWALLMEKLGDRILIIGDDLVTTKDANIELCARMMVGDRMGITNATLIKANQIGTLTETVLAMLTALAYGQELVVSHRSKSPNDPFEAEIATAMNTVGLKAGGGANTERLQKYGRVVEILALAETSQRELGIAERREVETLLKELILNITGRNDIELLPEASSTGISQLLLRMLAIETVRGREESTNAGIPTGHATLLLDKAGTIRFMGSTPLGTSAGEDEAIHYVDSIVQPSALTKKYANYFTPQLDGTLRFKKGLKLSDIETVADQELMGLWQKTQRYGGKGCMDAVANIETVLAKAFVGRKLASLGGLLQVDRELLKLERDQAIEMGRLDPNAPEEQVIHAMQRKGNLGMNAILSMSLALGRAVAAREGKELWQMIRETAAGTMVRFIAEVTGRNAEELGTLKFDQLVKEYRLAAKGVIDKGQEVHPILREHLPVYDVGTHIVNNYGLVRTQLDTKHRKELDVLDQHFDVQGSLVYEVEIRIEDGREVPYLRVKEESRTGLAQGYDSKAVGKFRKGSSHKAFTIIRGEDGKLGIFVDGIAERHGPEFKGQVSVAIPDGFDRNGKGTITLLIGKFDETINGEEKVKAFPEIFRSMRRYVGDREYVWKGKIERSQVENIVKAAFAKIPWIDFWIKSSERLFEEYIQSEFNG
jgi:enolase